MKSLKAKTIIWVLIATQLWLMTPGGDIRNAYAGGHTDGHANQGAGSADGDLNFCDDLCGRIIDLFGTGGDSRKVGTAERQKAEQYCQTLGAKQGGATLIKTQGGGDGSGGVTAPSGSTGNCVTKGKVAFATDADGKVTQSGASTTNSEGNAVSGNTTLMGPDGNPRTCDQLGSDFDACGWLANGQLVSQCLAYAAASQKGTAWGMEILLIILDTAGAVVCYLACAMPTMQLACTLTAVGVALAEIAGIAVMASDKTASAMDGVAAAGGIVGGVMGAINGIIHGADSAASSDKMACLTAAVFTLTLVLRIAGLVSMGTTASSACGEVKKLSGSNDAPNAGPSSGAGGTFAGAPPGGGGGGGSGSGASGGSSNGRAGGGVLEQARACQSAEANQSQCPGGLPQGVVQGATDGALIKGLGSNFKPPIPDAKEVAAQAKSGGAAGLLSSGLSGSGADPGPLLAVAAAANEDKDKLSAALGGAYSGGGGGGGGGGGAKGDGGGLAALGGLFGGGAPGAKDPGTAAFGKTTGPDNDIFHSNSPHSIFEIHSDKIGKVSSRFKAK